MNIQDIPLPSTSSNNLLRLPLLFSTLIHTTQQHKKNMQISLS